MRPLDGGAAETAPVVSAYMPGYNTTTAGRLRRIRQQRGVSPHKLGGGSSTDATDSSAVSVRPRRCPLREGGPIESRQQQQQQQQQQRNLSSTERVVARCYVVEGKGVPPLEATLTTHTLRGSNNSANEDGNNSKGNTSLKGRKFFLRPPSGSNVPVRLGGYEKYVRDCIQRHREASDRGRGGAGGHRGRGDRGVKVANCSQLFDEESNHTEVNGINGFSENANESVHNGNGFVSEDSSYTRSYRLEEPADGSTTTSSHVRNGTTNGLSRSTSALDSVRFIASSDEFEDCRPMEVTVKEWNVKKKPADFPRPPRFGPSASIDEMRHALSGTIKPKLRKPPHQPASIEAEYLANLTALRRLAATSTSSSSSSSFGLSLSLSAELRANQAGLGGSTSGATYFLPPSGWP